MKILAIAAVGAFMMSGTAFTPASAVSIVKQTIKQDQASGPVVASGSGNKIALVCQGWVRAFVFKVDGLPRLGGADAYFFLPARASSPCCL